MTLWPIWWHAILESTSRRGKLRASRPLPQLPASPVQGNNQQEGPDALDEACLVDSKFRRQETGRFAGPLQLSPPGD